jgi:phenylacetate-CoA ligase
LISAPERSTLRIRAIEPTGGELKPLQHRSLEQLRPHQQELWRRQRLYVGEHSAFYRQLWQGEPPPQQLQDLARLPLSSKAELRLSQQRYPPFGDYLASSRAQVTRLHRTSGTSGQAMNLALSARDCEITETVGGRAQRLAGLGPGHSVVHCLNYQMWMGGVTDHLTLEKTGAMVVPFGVGSTDLLIDTIRQVGINAISCTPSYPAVIEKALRERFPGLDPRDLGLELGLFGGEAGLDDPALRQRIRDTWGMEPRNANYGVSDVLSNFAAQCEWDTRLHFLAADVLYPELIDPQSGATLALEAGVEGELVLTHLQRDCQPLVRFRSGDIVAVDSSERCRCGHQGIRFRVVGRSDDMVVVRGINVFPSMIASAINGFDALSGNYRIPLDTRPPYDWLPVAVELAVAGGAIEGLAADIETALKRALGASARVTLLPPGSFELTEGKTRRVLRNYQ